MFDILKLLSEFKKIEKVKFTRDELINRHRLSRPQADDFLGYKTEPPDRATQMKKLRELGYFLKLMEEMKSEGLDPIVLKGPALSEKIYGDPFYRSSNDFDLLFAQTEISQAIEFFECRGFTGKIFNWPVSEKKQKITKELEKQYCIYNSKQQIIIEIHWKLFDRRLVDPSVVEDLVRKNTGTVEINGHTIIALDSEFQLLYLTIHGSLHAWFRLKWLVDIHKIINQDTIDGERFKRLTQKLDADRFVSVCNGVLGHIYKDTKLLPCDELSSSRLIEEAVYQIKRPENDPFDAFDNTVRQVRYQLALSEKWQYKRDIFRTLLFNKRDLNISWLPAGKWILFFFRPLTFMMRKFGWIT